jgi:hypothetical protein
MANARDPRAGTGANGHGAMDGDVFAENVPIANFDNGRLAAICEVLGCAAEN